MPDFGIFSVHPLSVLPSASSGGEVWTSVAMSADGSHIALPTGKGFLYLTTDSGKTWTRTWAAGQSSGTWNSSDKSLQAMSSSGKFIGYVDDVADPLGGQLSISADGGSSWKLISSIKEHNWQNISCSPSGKYWAALSLGDGSENSAASNSSGVALFLSSDFGVTWHADTSIGVGAGTSSDLSPQISDNGQVALVDQAGLHLSSNFGESWRLTKIGVSPATVTAVAFTGDASELVAATGDKLYFSSDLGQSWMQSKYSGFHNLVFLSPGATPTTVNAIDSGSSLQVLQSTDNSRTWKQLGKSTIPSSMRIPLISAKGQDLITTDGNNVLTSGNSGNTWSPITGDLSRLWTAAYWGRDGNSVVATSQHFTYMEGEDFASDLFVSNDLKRSWTGIGADNPTYPNQAPADFGSEIVVTGPIYPYGRDGLIYGTEFQHGSEIYKSTDGGLTWATVIPNGTNFIDGTFVSTPDGKVSYFLTLPNKLWVTKDHGIHWSQRSIPTTGSSSDLTGLQVNANGKELVTYTQGNIFISNDGGVMWTKHPLSLPLPIRQLVMSNDGQTISILLNGPGSHTIYESRDAGVSWQKNNVPGGSDPGSLEMSKSGRYQAVLNSAGTDNSVGTAYIYFSKDYGKSWDALSNAGKREWTNIAVSPDGSKILATGDGAVSNSPYSDLYLSTDFGKSWSDISQTANVVWGKSLTGK